MAVGSFYPEIEGQSWLLENYDRNLLKIDKIRRQTKQKRKKNEEKMLQSRHENILSKILHKTRLIFFLFNRLAIICNSVKGFDRLLILNSVGV